MILSKLTPRVCSKLNQVFGVQRHSSHQLIGAGQHFTGTSSILKSTNQSIFSQTIRRFTDSTAEQLTIRRNKIIGVWLMSCAGLTFVTVCAGGLTRLTESGLSMVDWHLFKEIPPRTPEQWEEEFEKYKQYPEWKVKNREISLDQFKFIWHMEYGHRSLGRIIGAVYFAPAALFWLKGWFTKSMKIRASIFGSILAFQGLLGWYMVKSGLEEKQEYAHDPRVSQYRLASHLGTAMVFYSLLFWNGLVNMFPNPPKDLPTITKSLAKFRRAVHVSKLLVFTTAMSGALVAGLDAGLVYNSWPKMADRWIPSDLFAKQPTWKNFFENATTVQFDHRHLGEFTGVFVLGMWAYSLKLKLPRRARVAVHFLALATVLQITLGIYTLLNYVPTKLAASHQANALLTLTASLWLSKELQWIRRVAK